MPKFFQRRTTAFIFLLMPIFIVSSFAYPAYAASYAASIDGGLSAAEAVELDETILPEDLGVGAPRILPGNPFYIFKGLARGIQSVIAFSPEKKAELKLRFANEKIVEVNELAKRGNFKRVESRLKNYEKDIEQIAKLVEKFKETSPELAEKFVEKSLKDQFRHQTLLGKFERKAPIDNLAKIKEVREKTLDHIAVTVRQNIKYNELGQVVGYSEALSTLGEISLTASGSPFKSLRNLEILKAVKAKVPEQAKDAIQLAQENSMRRFKEQLDAMSEDEQGLLAGYVERAGGDEAIYIEALDELTSSIENAEVQKRIIAAKDKLMSRIQDRVKEADEKNPNLAEQLFKPELLAKIQQRIRFGQLLQRVNSLQTSTENLREDAAGLGVSERLKVQIESLARAERNMGDAVSVLQTAEGAMGEVAGILVRMRELAVQAANDSITDEERAYIDDEYEQLRDEVDRIAYVTDFNNISLTDGTNPSLDFEVGIDNTSDDRITIDLGDLRTGSLGIGSVSLDTVESASAALGSLDEAIDAVNGYRSDYGSLQNRLSSALDSLEEYTESLKKAISDIAEAENEKLEIIKDIPTVELEIAPKLKEDLDKALEPIKELLEPKAETKKVETKPVEEKVEEKVVEEKKEEVKEELKMEPQSIVCPTTFSYVCGIDGNTYDNSCKAGEAGATVQYSGKCIVEPEPEPYQPTGSPPIMY